MRIHSLLVTSGLLLCAGLGVAFVQIKNEAHALSAKLAEIQHDIVAVQSALTAAQHELATQLTNAATFGAERREWHELGRIPADRIRRLVAPTLAAIGTEQAADPLPPRQPPPPVGPSGSLFPELMGEPRYSLLAKHWEELLISLQCRPRLQQAGVPPQTIDRVLDLLAEQRMVELDYQSLRAQYRPNAQAAYAQQQTAVARVDAQIRDALGPELYDRLSLPTPHVTTAVLPNGQMIRTSQTTSEFAPYGNSYENLLQPLETRLSYSPDPLSKRQVSLLTGILESHALDNPYEWMRTKAGSTPAVQSVLSPQQLRALAELQAEHDASLARAKLPGS